MYKCRNSARLAISIADVDDPVQRYFPTILSICCIGSGGGLGVAGKFGFLSQIGHCGMKLDCIICSVEIRAFVLELRGLVRRI